MTVADVFPLIRTRQWTKNLVIFAALIFSGHANEPSYVLRSAIAFILFSLGTGAVYIFNDILDLSQDQEHPVKRNRPIAAGRVNVRTAVMIAMGLIVAVLIGAFSLQQDFGTVILVYLGLQVLYMTVLKRVVIVDVLTISFGFLLRVVAGAVVIEVMISNWILVCAMLLALFLALSKRRHELTLLKGHAVQHRDSLGDYNPYLLDQMIGVVSSATLVAYTIFTLSPETIEKFGNLVVTVPFVLYGIFRYLLLVHVKDEGGQPEETLLADIPLQVDILLYGAVSLMIIYMK